MLRAIFSPVILTAAFLFGFHAAAEEPALPNTPAGKQFAAWLAAYNSGRYEIIRQFLAERSETNVPVEDIAKSDSELFRNDGRYELRKVAESSSTGITCLVQANPTEFWVQIKLATANAGPYKIESLRYSHVEMPANLIPHSKLPEREIQKKTDALLAHLVKEDAFSGVLLVAKDGNPIYEKAYGLANLAGNVTNRVDTRFNIASLAKMFTAVAIAQLVERGKLSYGDTLGKVLPDYPNKTAARVTIHQLLTHTAGFKSKSLGLLRRGFRRVQDFLPSFENDPLLFEPGARYEYSNDGYLALGAIIEKVSGESYDDYLRDHIFKPAGMTDTGNYELDTHPPNIATGYMDGPNGTRRENTSRLPVKGLPFGLGYSTAPDLLRFDVALRNHTLLTAASLAEVWAGKVDEGADGTQYGYGFDIKRYNGTRIIGHSGGWAGVTAQMDLYPDPGYAVIILTNIDCSPRSIAYKLREWLTQGPL